MFDEGLEIVHVDTLIVSHNAKIGKNCRIHVYVNIGSSWINDEPGASEIEDKVFIAFGVKMLCPICIGDNTWMSQIQLSIVLLHKEIVQLPVFLRR